MACLKDGAIFIGKSNNGEGENQYLPLKWGNRHGLIAGATGTGKTVTLQCLAEGFSNAGVPVFMADVKGDLSGLCRETDLQDFLVKRAKLIGLLDEYEGQAFPTVFWDLFAKQGHPIRTTISEIGPLLLSRMLELNDTQEGVLNIAFRVADEQGLLLLDLKDLRALLNNLSEQRKEVSASYGNVSPQSIGAIQRSLLRLEDQGADQFFGEPALDVNDFMRKDSSGRGVVNILAANDLMNSPRLYGTFLLWLLSELFEELGVGEALVSTLEDKGQPSIVQRTMIRPPSSKLGAVTRAVRKSIMMESVLSDKYDETIDNESAYEVLQKRAEKAAEKSSKKPKAKKRKSSRQSVGEAAVKSLVRSVSSSVGRTIAREIVRGIMGAFKR